MKPSEVNCVITHRSCPDGWGAAWAAWKLIGDNAEYHFLTHEDPPPDVKGKNVLMVDFAFTGDDCVFVMNSMIEDANDFLLLDHHKSARDKLDGNINCKYVFNMGKSGAMLAWEYFHPEKDVPPMILYIQDRDLWNWKLPDAKEYLASFDSYAHTFEVLDMLNGTTTSDMVDEGAAICRYQQILIDSSVRKAEERYLKCPDGSEVLAMVVNNSSRQLVSNIGNELADDIHVGAIWSYHHGSNNKGDSIYVSLRSVGKNDVAMIAEKFGGGGHKNASGFIYHGSIKSLFVK